MCDLPLFRRAEKEKRNERGLYGCVSKSQVFFDKKKTKKPRNNLLNYAQFQSDYILPLSLIEPSPKQSSLLTRPGQYYSSKFNQCLHTQLQGKAVNNPAGAGVYYMSKTQINKSVIISPREVLQPRA